MFEQEEHVKGTALKTKGCVGMLPQKIFKQLRCRSHYFLRLGFMELRAGTVGVRVRLGFPFFLLLVQLMIKTLNGDETAMKQLPNGSRGEETVTQDKTKNGKLSHFYFYFVKQWYLGRILFIISYILL